VTCRTRLLPSKSYARARLEVAMWRTEIPAKWPPHNEVNFAFTHFWALIAQIMPTLLAERRRANLWPPAHKRRSAHMVMDLRLLDLLDFSVFRFYAYLYLAK
jgi:hypothetical protein